MSSAAVDLGTNTLRVLIRDVSTGRDLFRKNYYLFLGNETTGGVISAEGLSKLSSVLHELREVFSRHHVKTFRAVATAFARSLTEPSELDNLFRSVLGGGLSIIDAETEGMLVCRAVTDFFGVSPDLIIDIGGGSTEFICHDSAGTRVVSESWGSLVLAARFFKSYPPSALEKERLCGYVRQAVGYSAIPPGSERVYGVGGTITTLAFLATGGKVYDPAAVNGKIVTVTDVENLYRTIEYLSLDKISSIFPLEKGREKVLLSGVLIVLTLMDTLRIVSFTASDTSLLNGIFCLPQENVFSM